MNLFAKDTLGIAFDDGEGSISWGWPIFSFVFALVLARLTATGLVPCDERIDYFVPYYQTWTTSSFEGHVIESESWVLLCGVQNEPLKFLRMKDCHEILEIKKPVWCIYTVNGETGSQLLVGVGDRIQLHSLPEMSLLLSIDLLDSVFHPNTASRYRSTSPPRLFLNNGWLLIECETSMRQLDGTGERYIEIAGWNRFSVGWSKSENPNPDFRKKLKIDLDSQSQPILCLDPINPILTIATIECALEVNLETGVSVEILPSQFVRTQQLEFNYPGQRRTNLAQLNWYVEAGSDRVELIPRNLSNNEIEKLDYSIRFAETNRSHLKGLVSYRKSFLPSPSLLCWTVLFPCYFWVLFLSLAKLGSRSLLRFSRHREFGNGILAFVCYSITAICLTNSVLNRGGLWSHGFIAWVVPALFLLTMSVLDSRCFQETMSLILWSVGIALPIATLTWWLSFAIPMPPIAITSHVFATFAMFFGYLVINPNNRTLEDFIAPFTITTRFSGAFLNLVICLQIVQAILIVVANQLYLDPKRSFASGFASGGLYEIAFYTVLLSIGAWTLAWCLQTVTGRYHKSRTLATFIVIVPFVVTAYHLKFIQILSENFIRY